MLALLSSAFAADFGATSKSSNIELGWEVCFAGGAAVANSSKIELGGEVCFAGGAAVANSSKMPPPPPPPPPPFLASAPFADGTSKPAKMLDCAGAFASGGEAVAKSSKMLVADACGAAANSSNMLLDCAWGGCVEPNPSKAAPRGSGRCLRWSADRPELMNDAKSPPPPPFREAWAFRISSKPGPWQRMRSDARPNPLSASSFDVRTCTPSTSRRVLSKKSKAKEVAQKPKLDISLWVAARTPSSDIGSASSALPPFFCALSTVRDRVELLQAHYPIRQYLRGLLGVPTQKLPQRLNVWPLRRSNSFASREHHVEVLATDKPLDSLTKNHCVRLGPGRRCLVPPHPRLNHAANEVSQAPVVHMLPENPERLVQHRLVGNQKDGGGSEIPPLAQQHVRIFEDHLPCFGPAHFPQQPHQGRAVARAPIRLCDHLQRFELSAAGEEDGAIERILAVAVLASGARKAAGEVEEIFISPYPKVRAALADERPRGYEVRLLFYFSLHEGDQRRLLLGHQGQHDGSRSHVNGLERFTARQKRVVATEKPSIQLLAVKPKQRIKRGRQGACHRRISIRDERSNGLSVKVAFTLLSDLHVLLRWRGNGWAIAEEQLSPVAAAGRSPRPLCLAFLLRSADSVL
eukprot:scaffold1340_cov253-Pinguiococcus_pyrenoidosus.AAC.19